MTPAKTLFPLFGALMLLVLASCGASSGDTPSSTQPELVADASCIGWLPSDFATPPGSVLSTCKETTTTRTLEGRAERTADADTLTAGLIEQLKAAGFAATDSSGTVMPGYKLISFDRPGTHGQMQLEIKDDMTGVWITLWTDLE